MDVIHPSKVAFESARTLTTAADSDVYWWLIDLVGQYLGWQYELKLAETRSRLRSDRSGSGQGAVFFSEAAAWRVRLEELLAERPEMGHLLVDLTRETSERLARY
ncbi:hypothetical protein J5X84_31175 [Streptosporangiaceae bacterium NEAU-GS5]|nr:hypothetical protein [Streptosporangiaceae bacterium NEAU-GS5]